VSRSKPALDGLDSRPLGDSANIVIGEDGKTAYVVNHHGAIDNAEFLQQGGRGNIAVMNIQKMIDPRHDNTAAALERHIDAGWTADGRHAVISGGPRTAFEPSGIVYIIDLRTRAVVGTVTGGGNDPYGLAVARQ
jgi:DNA-binding beta-propeller fold protein YncE